MMSFAFRRPATAVRPSLLGIAVAAAAALPALGHAAPSGTLVGNALSIQGDGANNTFAVLKSEDATLVSGVGGLDPDLGGPKCVANTPFLGTATCTGVASIAIRGGAGNDTITTLGNIYYPSGVELSGEGGDDTLTNTTSNSNAKILGGDGNDVISATGAGVIGPETSGEADDDTLIGNDTRADSFAAELGADTYRGGTAPRPAGWLGPWLQQGVMDGYTAANGPIRLKVTLDGAANDGRGGEGDNLGNDIESIVGSASADVIDMSGISAANTFVLALAGDDRVVGGPFDDSISDGSGNDIVTAGAGDDTVFGSDATNSATPNPHITDTVDLGEGDDEYRGTSAGCTQPAGTETVGGLGPDIVTGGPGRDLVRMDSVMRTVAGSCNPGEGTVENHPISVSLDGVANDGTPGQGANVKEDVEDVVTGNGNDTITGSPSTNSISTGHGDDNIDGLGGADSILAGYGVDTITSRDQTLDWIDCGQDVDTPVKGDTIDVLSNCEGNHDLAAPPVPSAGSSVGAADTTPAKLTVVKTRVIRARKFARSRTLTALFTANEPVRVHAQATSTRLAKGVTANIGTVGSGKAATKGSVSIRVRGRFARRLATLATAKRAPKKGVSVKMTVTGIDAGGNISRATVMIWIRR